MPKHLNRPPIHPNLYKFKTPPTVEMVKQVLVDSGLSNSRFEIIHGMYHSSIKHILKGYRKVPIQHWHLFYAPGKPAPTFRWMLSKMQKAANPKFPKHPEQKPKKERKKRSTLRVDNHPQLKQFISE